MSELAVMPLREEHAFLDAALRTSGLDGVPVTSGAHRHDTLPGDRAHHRPRRSRQGPIRHPDPLPARHAARYRRGDLRGCRGGAAGALDRSLGVGDIVQGEATIEHDYLLRFITRPLPVFPGTVALIERFRTTALANGLAVRTGTIASGDEDIIDVARGADFPPSPGRSSSPGKARALLARAC